MPSDTTRTATDAAPAVKIGDKVRARVCSNWYGRAGKVIAVRGRFIVVKWSKEPQPMVYILNSNDSFDFHDCCEVCPADVVKPSRRALREQLQQAEAERDSLKRVALANQQAAAAECEKAMQAELQLEIVSTSLKVTGHALEQAIAERGNALQERDITHMEVEGLQSALQLERDAHAQTKAEALSEAVSAEIRLEAEKLDRAQYEQRVEQELQQARGLIETAQCFAGDMLTDYREGKTMLNTTGLSRATDLRTRADAFLAGTMAVESSAQELAQHPERT